ncbi:aflatoxin B1-aldehyde reductase [Dendrothele bispora CBS 962.96]|uniref:Aflatoxin B1-aldehyde reductase n=1 Tax=Dendrothele bispora (strain CBS 962.96) TaxID=1314807 RepID=A0A4S8MJ30_DENBC|nr:aflatoxin B1-aldehyde reductase [Dendrothele bispora CBS 962.96]
MTFSTRIPLIYGAAGFGAPGTGCKITSISEAQPIMDEFCKHGPMAIDTSARYGAGTSEQMLAEMNLHGSCVDTKVYPVTPGDHSAAKLREACEKSVASLKGNKIRVYYLHAPDYATPFEETLKTIDELYKEGKFEFFGLSNYKSYQVAEMVTICRAKGWVVPTVYQGVYNPIDRTIETELIPCLRHFNIKFAAYCPLAGGFLVGHLLMPGGLDNAEAGSHFDKNFHAGSYYNQKYGRMVGPVTELKDVVEKHGLNLNQASVRWLQHHSIMIPSDLGIIFGGSKPSHVDRTLEYNSEGPLPDAVVEKFEECYDKVKAGLPNYHHDAKWYDVEKYGY